jgi:hypothetical protein
MKVVMMTKLTSKEGKQIGLALGAFLAAWTAANYELTAQAILGSIAAALTGLIAPQKKP